MYRPAGKIPRPDHLAKDIGWAIAAFEGLPRRSRLTIRSINPRLSPESGMPNRVCR
jgi:hypothetical protein